MPVGTQKQLVSRCASSGDHARTRLGHVQLGRPRGEAEEAGRRSNTKSALVRGAAAKRCHAMGMILRRGGKPACPGYTTAQAAELQEAPWRKGRPSSFRLEHAAADLVELDRIEQGLEIAFAEALIALALDDLEEDRADDGAGEDLQQQILLSCLVDRLAVDQDIVLAQPCQVLAVLRQALVDGFVIGVGVSLKVDAPVPQRLPVA